jgi:hypothetical protein
VFVFQCKILYDGGISGRATAFVFRHTLKGTAPGLRNGAALAANKRGQFKIPNRVAFWGRRNAQIMAVTPSIANVMPACQSRTDVSLGSSSTVALDRRSHQLIPR